MTRTAQSVIVFVVIFCLASADVGRGTTRYHVRLSPQQGPGLTATIAFDLTSSDTNSNTLRILNFAHNGNGPQATSQGGPVFGKLFDGANPADTTTIEDFGFYNQLNVGFSGLGGVTTFTVDLSETAPCAACLPDELGLFLTRTLDQSTYPTADDLQADALFALDVTGQAGGDLSVFSPAVFVPPDSVLLIGNIVSVPGNQPSAARLHFVSVAPNPSAMEMIFTYEVPPPGGELRVRIFDMAGRLVAEPFSGQRPPGRWTTHWDSTDGHGRVVAAGVYLVHLQMDGQSLTRRVVLAR